MKNYTFNLFKLLFVMLIALSFTACGWLDDDDDDNPIVNIVRTMEAEGNLDTLITALEAGELDDDLQGEGPFTIFAPTDDAFNALPAGVVNDLLDPANQNALIDLLTFHVYDGRTSRR